MKQRLRNAKQKGSNARQGEIKTSQGRRRLNNIDMGKVEKAFERKQETLRMRSVSARQGKDHIQEVCRRQGIQVRRGTGKCKRAKIGE